MTARDIVNLLLLAALWGISVLFVRIAAPEFGAVPLIAVRVAVASLVLLPIVIARRALGEIRRNWGPIALMGILHYAIPFTLFAWAMLTLSGDIRRSSTPARRYLRAPSRHSGSASASHQHALWASLSD